MLAALLATSSCSLLSSRVSEERAVSRKVKQEDALVNRWLPCAVALSPRPGCQHEDSWSVIYPMLHRYFHGLSQRLSMICGKDDGPPPAGAPCLT